MIGDRWTCLQFPKSRITLLSTENKQMLTQIKMWQIYVILGKKNHVYFFPQSRITLLSTENKHVVLGKTCSQSKHTAAHVLPGRKMPTASFA